MMWYFTLALTSFLWTAENPAAICSPSASDGSHTPALPQCFLVRHLSSVVLWAVEGSRLPACVLFSAHAQAAFLPPAYPESRSVLQLPAGFSLCQHGFDLRQQRLNVCVVPFLHNKPPDVVYFPTSGGFCHCPFLLDRFTERSAERPFLSRKCGP